MLSGLLTMLGIQVVLLVVLATYLIKKRNTSVIGWLINLNLLCFMALLFEALVVIQNVLLAAIFAILLMAVVVIVGGGLIFSFVFLFINAYFAWKREGRSLSSSLTLILGIGVILVDIFFLFDPINAPKPIQNFITMFLTLFIFYILLTVWNTMVSMIVYNLYFPKYDKDYIIVLGSGLIDGYKVGRLLGNRINKGIEFYHLQLKKTAKHAKLIFSGGQGGDEKIPEGVAMKKYALDQGVPEIDTLVEDKSINTRQNLIFSDRIIKNDSGRDDSKIVFVTNNFHTLRGGILAGKLGIPATGIGAKTPFYYLPNAVIREYLALFVMHKRFHIAMMSLIFVVALLAGASSLIIK
ncbi:MAG: YdcF family protein [Lentilactobacillus hilgardii]|uniref:YdcF family protein n=8 Tax=Lentilactobacillus hilgardii TaxID=1588 RepID=UPI0039EA703F